MLKSDRSFCIVPYIGNENASPVTLLTVYNVVLTMESGKR